MGAKFASMMMVDRWIDDDDDDDDDDDNVR